MAEPPRKWVRDARGRRRRRYQAVMEEHLGRDLLPDEVVHHINGDPLDDRLENLRLMSRAEHSRLHMAGKPKTSSAQLAALARGRARGAFKVGNTWAAKDRELRHG